MYSMILVDYRSMEKTIRYLGLCCAQLGIRHAVIVDNGDSPRGYEPLEQCYGPGQLLELNGRQLRSYEADGCRVLYCHSGENLGYAKGNNLGVTIAESVFRDPYYLISNNDLAFPMGFSLETATELFEAMPRVGVIGPRVVTPAGEDQSPRKLLSPFRKLVLSYWIHLPALLLPRSKRKAFWDKHCNDTVAAAPSGRCHWVSGCFMLVRAEAFRDADMFDPNTFLYAEEPILAARMEQKGWQMYFCRELTVVHEHGATTKKTFSAIKGMGLEFESNCYFYQTYRGVAGIWIGLAKLSFRVFSWLLGLKYKLSEK